MSQLETLKKVNWRQRFQPAHGANVSLIILIAAFVISARKIDNCQRETRSFERFVYLSLKSKSHCLKNDKEFQAVNLSLL